MSQGLKEITAAIWAVPCSWRRSAPGWVTDLLEQNVPLEDVQYLAGHADPRTTRIYTLVPDGNFSVMQVREYQNALNSHASYLRDEQKRINDIFG